MGYTHYYYVAKEFDTGSFAKVATDFKKMITPLKHLGVILADGRGENYPLISPTEIRFNGLAKCGHPKRDLGITWPSSKASGISKNNTDTQQEEITKSDWFAGAKLQTRACGGDCSHETFTLEQKLKTTMTRYDDSTYELEPQGEYSVVTQQDGTRDKNPANEVGKYFQFTKTAYKPYDLAVTMCLVIAKHYLGEQISISSDGTMKNWHEAMQLCHHFLGYGKGFKLDDDESVPLDPASAEAMISECRKNQVEIKAIQTEQEEFRDQKEQEIAEIKDKYDNTINDLESQKYRETEKIANKIDDAQKEADQKTDELAKAKTALDRTIYFLKMQEEQLDCKPLDEITNDGDKHLETTETYKDDCMELRLYVAENEQTKEQVLHYCCRQIKTRQ